MITVLVVEDDKLVQEFLRLTLDGKVKIISAFTVKEAEKRFEETSTIDAIVMDGCVPGRILNTIPLVEKIRITFKGPIIAASSVDSYREELIKAGCDFECEKEHIPSKLCQILGL